jgi:hypothetical protein
MAVSCEQSFAFVVANHSESQNWTLTYEGYDYF